MGGMDLPSTQMEGVGFGGVYSFPRGIFVKTPGIHDERRWYNLGGRSLDFGISYLGFGFSHAIYW